MKKLYIGFVLISVLAGSCKKDKQQGSQQVIVGGWELRLQTGGIAPRVEYNPGNGCTWFFAANGSFVQTFPSGSDREGTYSVTRVTGASDYSLSLNYTTFPNTIQAYSVQFNSSDTLVFLPESPCCDYPATYYKRVQMPD
jgi:hypothetical protein